MLTEAQADDTWFNSLQAEVRSYYFADLGARYTRRKQIITGVSFFLTSGAAATMLGHLQYWIPVLLATLPAVLMAYSMAVSLDQKAVTMAKLQYTWSQIGGERRRIWEHWYEEDAESALKWTDLRAAEASQTAVTDAPYNQTLLQKWETFVYAQHKVDAA